MLEKVPILPGTSTPAGGASAETDRATRQPASAGIVTEIICISCWSSFEVSEGTLEDPASEVTCPHCGFSQPGPGPAGSGPPTDRDAPGPKTVPPPIPTSGGQRAPGATSAPTTIPGDDPFAEMSHELGVEAAEDALHDGPPPAPVEEEPPWRVRTTTGLNLHFPDFESANRWASGHEGGGLGIALGDDAFRHYAAFREALQEHRDPVVAIESLSPAESKPAAATPAASPASAPSPAPGAVKPKPSQPGAEAKRRPPKASDVAEAKAASRRRSMSQQTGDFTFRTSKATSPWPGRLLFFGVGLALGGGVVYYLSWLGVMPGIRY